MSGKWRCVAMHDPTGRRGIWYREQIAAVSICAGREGDDWKITLRVGQVLTARDIAEVLLIMSTGAWMVEEAGIEAIQPSVATRKP